MKKIAAAATLILGVMTCGQASAASSATLQVKGSILPPACNAEFSSGAALSWEDIDPTTLTNKTTLETKQATLNITCNTASLYAIKATDNQDVEAGSPFLFALTSDNEKSTMSGNYTIKALREGSLVDQEKVSAFIIYNGTSWSPPQTTDIVIGNEKQAPSLFTDMLKGSDTERSPAANKVFALTITPHLYKGTGNPAGINLSGSATFEIIYM